MFEIVALKRAFRHEGEAVTGRRELHSVEHKTSFPLPVL
jgi:hypothetical protein